MSSKSKSRAARDVAELFSRAQRHHQAGELAAAEALYRDVLARDPNHADGFHLLGVVAIQVGRGDIAVGLIERAIVLRPRTAAYHFNLANTLIGLNRRSEAEANLRAAIAFNGDLVEAHNNLANLLIEAGRHAEAAECLQAAVSRRPGFVEAHSNLAGVLLLLDRKEEAAAAFEVALRLRPGMAELHYNLGDALDRLGRASEAEARCREAVRLKPDYFEAWTLLGILCASRNAIGDAEAAFRKAAALRPDHGRTQVNLGKMLLRLHRSEEAASTARSALRVLPDDPEAHTVLAFALLQLGRWREAWPEYAWRWKDPRLNLEPREFDCPIWTGEALSGRTLLLHAEQGFGDTLQLLRYAAQLPHDGKVIVEVQKPLARLAATLEGVDRILARGEPLPGFDLHCPLFSLPRIFGTTVETIPNGVPYLSADPIAVERWRTRLAGAGTVHIGLVWAGNRNNTEDETRSIPLAAFAALAGLDGVTFVSLQKGEGDAEAAQPPAGLRLLDFTPELADFADTAALVAALDLVIGVDTAVVHLAGALGRPVWLLNRFHAEWRWLRERTDSPWYPTLRQFRQREPSNWDDVISDVRAALADRLAGSSPTLL
jgi:tetratricopeptide (TPR) repeat protein